VTQIKSAVWIQDKPLGHALPMVEHSSLDKVNLRWRIWAKHTHGIIFFPDDFSVDQRDKTFINFGLVQVRGFD
jgi:hypothetical protein